jgi:hypothetical protein
VVAAVISSNLAAKRRIWREAPPSCYRSRKGELVDERGVLQISWPERAADNSPLALDLLLATAT